MERDTAPEGSPVGWRKPPVDHPPRRRVLPDGCPCSRCGKLRPCTETTKDRDGRHVCFACETR